MKKIKKRIPIYSLFLLLLGVAVATGCVKRELEYDFAENNVVITLDWENEPHPQKARFLFYDQAGALFCEHTGLTDGYKGTLPAGNYRLVVHNEDARQVDYRGTAHYETAEVFALRNDYTQSGYRESEIPCILEPQAVYGTGTCQEFATLKVRQGERTWATVKPKRLTRQVAFHFVMSSHEEVHSLVGVLNGVAPGLFIATGKQNAGHACAMEFATAAVPPQKSSSTSQNAVEVTIHNRVARLHVFNLLSTEASPDGTNTISVMIALADGRRYPLDIDLTPTLRDIIRENDGSIPAEIPLEITIRMHDVDNEMTTTVKPWKEGTGSGNVGSRS